MVPRVRLLDRPPKDKAFSVSAVVLLVVMLSVVCSGFVLGRMVAAQSVPVIKPKGLTLSPLRTELDIAPGTSIDKTLIVTNSTEKPMTVQLSAEEFSVINQQYDYAFTEESELAKWIEFTPSEVTLAKGESRNVAYRVGVPLNAEPGGRYVGLFASTDTEAVDNGVGSRQRIASLLYISVIGEVTRSGHLATLSSPWVVWGKASWSMALQNKGTTHYRSRYDVKVQDIFGRETGVLMAGDALILPATIRSLADTLPLPKLPGLYKYVYTIGLGDSPAVIETRLVLYVPPVAVMTTIVLFVVIGLLYVYKKSSKR